MRGVGAFVLSCVIRARGSLVALELIRSHAREVLRMCAREGSTFPYRGPDRPKNADLSLQPGPDHGAAGGVQVVKCRFRAPGQWIRKKPGRAPPVDPMPEKGIISPCRWIPCRKNGALNKSQSAGWKKRTEFSYIDTSFFLVELQRTAAGLLYPGLFLCLFQFFQCQRIHFK